MCEGLFDGLVGKMGFVGFLMRKLFLVGIAGCFLIFGMICDGFDYFLTTSCLIVFDNFALLLINKFKRLLFMNFMTFNNSRRFLMKTIRRTNLKKMVVSSHETAGLKMREV